MPYARSDKAKLWYEVSGEGPPLVLIGGFALVDSQFEFCDPYLRKHHTIIHWHYQGVGKSDWSMTAPYTLEGWVDRARTGSAVFEAETDGGRRVYAGAALAGRDVYVLFSAPAPGLLSWARLNPMSTLLLPLGAWLTAFAAVMRG